MAQQFINIGTANGENGDFVRDAFDKANDNFTELYALQFYTDRIISASASWSGTGLIFDVNVDLYILNGNVLPAPESDGTIIPITDQITLSAADPSDPRIDIIVVNEDETISVVEGTPAASPQEPTPDFGSQLKITSILIPAGATTPGGSIDDEDVYLENAGEPTEWTTTESTSGARINLSSTNDPDTDSISIETSSINIGDIVTFTNDSSITASNFNTVTFRVKKKTAVGSAAGVRIRVACWNSGFPVSSAAVMRSGYYGYSSSISTYQTVNIPSTDLDIFGTEFDRITFTFLTDNEDCYIDNVRVTYSDDNPPTSDQSFLNLTDVVDNTYVGKNGYVPVVTNEQELTLQEIDTSTGLEILDEGNGNGWRLIGRDAANYGDIGLGAIDFVTSSGPSSGMGARGNYSIGAGYDNRIDADYSAVFGLDNVSIEGTFGSTHFISGVENTNYAWTYGTINVGYLNEIGTSGSTGGGNPVGWYSGTLGAYNELYGGRGSYLLGSGLLHGGAFCTVVGAANVDITNTTANQNWAPSNDGSNPGFIVGIGDVNSSTPASPSFTRRNGFIVWRDGTAELPTASTTEIDSRGDTAIPTVEWVNSNIGSAGNLQSVTVELTPSELENIGSTPKEIIPAPSTITDINTPIMIIYKFDWETVAFDSNTIDLEYASGETIPVQSSFNVGGTADEFQVTTINSNYTPEAGAAINLTGTDSGASGDSVLTVIVYYLSTAPGAFGGISDYRLKKNIKILKTINGIELVSWTWNKLAKALYNKSGKDFGVIAQQVKEINEDAVYMHEDGYYRVNYNLVTKLLNK